MKNNNPQAHLRRCLLASAIAAGLGIPAAQAFEVDTGNPDWSIRFDNTLKYNYGVRTESVASRVLSALSVRTP